jgi:transposase
MITDKQWKKLEPLFPKLKRRRDRRGRPWADNRACFEGVLWVLRTGARWRDLPPQYPSGSTCWRRLQDWEEQGALEEIWHSLLSQLDRRGLLRWEETFHGRQFCLGKKRGLAVGKTKRGKSRFPHPRHCVRKNEPGREQRMEIVLGVGWGRGIWDGMSRGRESGRSDAIGAGG